jgi:predicted nuclease of predicted toxin-antitoxin system
MSSASTMWYPMGLRLLANENIPEDAIAALRAAGHDVACASDQPTTRDPDVLRRASAEQRILLTFDKDFGGLAFAARQPAPHGIILLRLRRRSPRYVI